MLKPMWNIPYEMHTDPEKVWISLQPHLLSRGYRLRPRYDPEWIPSWTNIPGALPVEFEEFVWGPQIEELIDAIRISIGMKLSSPELRADPRNNAVPVLDVILIPGNDEMALLVMPFLMDFSELPFRRVGEVVEMVEQFLECLEFLHEHNITHMDFCWFNMMMDASRMVPRGWHFCNAYDHEGRTRGKFEWIERWTVRPVKYYLIDFGLSKVLSPTDDPGFLRVWGQDKTAPEMSETVPANTVKVDVYHLGNVIKKLTDEYTGLKILKSLAKKMTNPDPVKRLTASQAVKKFQRSKASWGTRTMEQRVWQRTTPFIDRFMVRYRNFSTII